MALKMRLRKQGRTHSPFYRIVVTEATARRDGAYKEALGWYNPMLKEENLQLDAEKAKEWVMKGAQPTEKVIALLKKAAPEAITVLTQRAVEKREKQRQKRKKAKA